LLGGGRRTCAGLAEQPRADELPLPAPPQECGRNFFHRWLRSSGDGTPIYSAVWEGDRSPPRAVIVYAHCFASHVHDPRGFQEKLLQPLAGRGFAVWGYDGRGQGRSGKAANRFGDIGKGEERMDDLATVIGAAQAHFAGVPVYLMGHSMGASDMLAFMSLRGGSVEGRAVQGLALLAPACDLQGRFSPFLRFLLKLEAWRGTTHFKVQDLWQTSAISKDLAHAGLRATDLAHLFHTCDRDGSGLLDVEEFERAVNKEMGLGLTREEIEASVEEFDRDKDGKVSIAELLRRLCASHPERDYMLSQFKLDTDFLWYDRVLNPSLVEPPLLLVHGRRDRVNRYEAARNFVEQAVSLDKTVKTFEDLRNGVAMDMDAPLVFSEVLAWLDARAPGA